MYELSVDYLQATSHDISHEAEAGYNACFGISMERLCFATLFLVKNC